MNPEPANMNDTVFNITIIGAGVVGLAVAEELSAQYSDVLVVEKTGPTGCKYERYP